MNKSCPLLLHFDRKGTQPAAAIKLALDTNNNDVPSKIDAMKTAIVLLINGDTTLSPPLICISTIVQYSLTSEDLTLQKLILLYLEIFIMTNKTDDDDVEGRGVVLLPETILIICRKLRYNLHHTNEYIRGITLRFFSRLNNETEIILPLITSVISNLKHRHPYVRRNALLALVSIYRFPQGEHNLFVDDDVLETIERLLIFEQDASVKRNAFLLLSYCARDRAINYLLSNADSVSEWGEPLQMVVLELIQKVYRMNNRKSKKRKYIRIVLSLLYASSSAPSIVYECAGSLVSLTSGHTAIRAAADGYCHLLLLSQSDDNNAKLLVLDRLNELLIKSFHKDVIDVDMIMDVLIKGVLLSSPNNLDIRRKTLDIIVEKLITPSNANEVVLTLKKEVMKTKSDEQLEKNGEYRQMLVQAIHSCFIKFPHLLKDFFLGDNNSNNGASAIMDVLIFDRERKISSKLRVPMVTKILDNFYQVREARVCSCALWIMGEYCLSLSEVTRAIATIKQCLGDLPFLPILKEDEEEYVVAQGSLTTTLNLRSLLLSGDFIVGAVVACTLSKLVLRLYEVQQSSTVEVQKASSYAFWIMHSMLLLQYSSFSPDQWDNDSYDCINTCTRLLINTCADVGKIWLNSCCGSLMLSDKQLHEETEEIRANAQTISYCSHTQINRLASTI